MDKIEALKEAGATREAAYAVLVDKLQAKTMVVDKFGDEHFADDNATQLRASELISRLHGDLRDGATTNINISAPQITITKDEFAALLEEDRKFKKLGQTGEIIDVPKYR